MSSFEFMKQLQLRFSVRLLPALLPIIMLALLFRPILPMPTFWSL